MIHELIDRARPAVERRQRRRDDGAHPRQREHVLEMDLVKRGLAHAEHEPAPLLQHDIGGPRNQSLAGAGGNLAERLHAARQDDHAQREERPARDRGALVGRGVDDGRQPLHLFHGVVGLVDQRPGAPAAEDQMCLHVGLAQPLEQADPVDRSARPGDADDKARREVMARFLARVSRCGDALEPDAAGDDGRSLVRGRDHRRERRRPAA